VPTKDDVESHEFRPLTPSSVARCDRVIPVVENFGEVGCQLLPERRPHLESDQSQLGKQNRRLASTVGSV
jgi:hypothetical protein